MPELREIYVDEMSGLSVSKDGQIVKFIFTTDGPDESGKIVKTTVFRLVMPAKAANEMIADITQAVSQHQAGRGNAPKN